MCYQETEMKRASEAAIEGAEKEETGMRGKRACGGGARGWIDDTSFESTQPFGSGENLTSKKCSMGSIFLFVSAISPYQSTVTPFTHPTPFA